MKNKGFLTLLASTLALPLVFGVASLNKKDVSIKVDAGAGNYYSSIGQYDTGTTLLNKLRTLNNTKRPKENLIPYNSLRSYFSRTDPYPGGGVTSFYTGQKIYGSTTREHVWPYSRLVLSGYDEKGERIHEGDNDIEQDLQMVRPCSYDLNDGRGNKFYTYESDGGYDPGGEGDETYRGEAARIIFYCVVADSGLSIVDKANDYSSNHTMGKLSTLIEWSLKYAPTSRENTRNDAVQNIQGHRNPFVDHPEYVCRIWGGTNQETKKLCDSQGYETTFDIKINDVSLDETSVSQNRSFDIASYANKSLLSPSTINWSYLNSSGSVTTDPGLLQIDKLGSTTRVTGLNNGTCYLRAEYTYNLSGGGTQTLYKYLTVNITDRIVLNAIRISFTPFVTEYKVGDTFTSRGIQITADYSDGTTEDVTNKVTYSNNEIDAPGTKTVIISYTHEGITKTTGYEIKILPGDKQSSFGCGGNISSTSIILVTLSSIGIVSFILSSIIRKRRKN